MHYQTKMMFKDAFLNMKSFIFNLLYFARHSQRETDLSALRNLVLSLPAEVRVHYAVECSFIETMSLDDMGAMMFPYRVVKENRVGEVRAYIEHGFSYTLHKEKKLFFPRYFSPLETIAGYKSLIEREGLFGTGVLEKSPHCYQDKDFKVEDGDVLLDVGCAEAIFALDNIEKVAKAYLFESESVWHKPLRLTFAPYADKTVIIKKLVSDKTTRKSIRLVDAVAGEKANDAHFFVKMDIEGWERTVIEGNAEFFKSAKVKLSCCVYHRQDDAQVIEAMLKKMGYKTRFSEGWMLPTMNGIHYPYFRHGVIYAQNY